MTNYLIILSWTPTPPLYFSLRSSLVFWRKWVYINLSLSIIFYLRRTPCQLYYSLILEWFPILGSDSENGEIQHYLSNMTILKIPINLRSSGHRAYILQVSFLAEKKYTMVHKFNNWDSTNYKWPWKSMLCGHLYFITTSNHSALEVIKLACNFMFSSHYYLWYINSEVRQTLFLWVNASSPNVMQLKSK